MIIIAQEKHNPNATNEYKVHTVKATDNVYNIV